MGHLRNFIRWATPNPLLRILSKLPQDAHVLFFWNRGLGDIALEIYPFIHTLKSHLQDIKVTCITREDLQEGFSLLGDQLTVFTTPLLKRKEKEDYSTILDSLGLSWTDFDHVFTSPDTRYWLEKQKKGLSIHLTWNESFFRPSKIKTKKPLALLHIHSETVYGFEKNLPLNTWQAVIDDLHQKGYHTVALGHHRQQTVSVMSDMRSSTSLYEIISMMLTPSSVFIGPDSGLLNILYYLNIDHPFTLVSFWSNTNVGLMKQNTPSFNRLLTHHSLIASDQNLSSLAPSSFFCKIPDMSCLHKLHLHEMPTCFSVKAEDVFTQTLKLSKYSLSKPVTSPHQNNPETEEFKSSLLPSPHLIPVILAGGHGTRLGFDKPKALFEIAGKTLLEHFIDKLKEASIKLSAPLKAIIIVSSDGQACIEEFLKTHHYFGLGDSQLKLITQKNLPLQTDVGDFVLKSPSSLYEAPNGNGEVFELLKEAGIFNDPAFQALGFEIIPIDNPLAPLFCGHHAANLIQGAEVSILATSADNLPQNVGKLASYLGKISIIEYSSNPPDHLNLANTGLMAFSYEFSKKQANIVLPLHVASKQYRCLTGKDYETLRLKKFETFIFDHLEWTTQVKVIKAKNFDVFQPLKAKEGPFGIEALEKALALQSFQIC